MTAQTRRPRPSADSRPASLSPVSPSPGSPCVLRPHGDASAPLSGPAPTGAAAAAPPCAPGAAGAALRPGETLTDRLRSRAPACAAGGCLAPADRETVRVFHGERWFRCAAGHLNAEMIDPVEEAA